MGAIGRPRGLHVPVIAVFRKTTIDIRSSVAIEQSRPVTTVDRYIGNIRIVLVAHYIRYPFAIGRDGGVIDITILQQFGGLTITCNDPQVMIDGQVYFAFEQVLRNGNLVTARIGSNGVAARIVITSAEAPLHAQCYQ